MTPQSGARSDATLAVYEARAAEWARDRHAGRPERAEALAARAAAGPIADLGCGPGWHLPHLGPRAVALDGARAMLDLVPERSGAPRVQADLAALPFRFGAMGGAWASKSYVHLRRTAMPMALADLHRSLAIGAPVYLTLFGGDADDVTFDDDDFAGRRFSLWPQAMVSDVVVGAGFDVDDLTVEELRRRGHAPAGGGDPGSHAARHGRDRRCGCWSAG